MYIRVRKICGKEFSSRSSRAFYCSECKKQKQRKWSLNYYRKKINTSAAWDIEKPVAGSMQRLYDISKYGVDYHEAKKKCEVDRLDKGKIKKIP
ncbi:MAG: hypothetical protein ACI4JB_09950 [Porcipelethomonas sp.]